MAFFADQINEIMNYYERMEKDFIEEYMKSPKGTLLSEKHNGKPQFLHYYPEAGKMVRRTITKDIQLQKQLARKEFSRKSAAILNKNVQLMRNAIREITPYDPNQIVQSMKKGYADLPKEYFFDHSEISIAMDLNDADKCRIMRHAKWGNEPYTENTYHNENKNKRTSRGRYVRSKSEQLIIESLYHFEIPHHYDEEEIIEGILVVSDFRFIDADDKPIFWEHMGMMDDPVYAKRNMRKLDRYFRAGIIPGQNLILSFDRDDTINMGIIDAIIRHELIPRL